MHSPMLARHLPVVSQLNWEFNSIAIDSTPDFFIVIVGLWPFISTYLGKIKQHSDTCYGRLTLSLAGIAGGKEAARC
jgi:hypothetical protein